MEGIRNDFNSLAEIIEYVSKNIETEKIENFIIENAAKLPSPMAAKELKGVIKEVLEAVKAARIKTPDDLLQDFKNEYPDSAANADMNNVRIFIKTKLLSERKDIVETFITENLKDHLNLNREKTNNLKKFFKEEAKALKNNSRKSSTSASINGIDAEFDGLYEEVFIVSSGKTAKVPKIDQIAYRVIKNLHVILYADSCFCYTNGYYKNNLIAVRAEAVRILSGICKDTASSGMKKKLVDVLTIVKNTNPINSYPFNKHDNAIPVKNGVVIIDFANNKISLEEHNPDEWKFSYILPVVFDENEKNDVILDELKKYTPDYKMLVQGIAQSLLQAMGYGPYKKAYLLKGKKNCGKTTFLDILEYLLGIENKSKVSLNELTPQYRFSKAEMEGKLVNVDDDLGYFKMSETGIFKKFTGGYSQKIERKGIDPYDIFITAVNFFTTNTPAGFDHRIFCDDAFWERWCFIEFDHEFTKDDSFKQRILNDRNISAFFNEVLKMIIEIKNAGQLPYVQDWTYVRDKWTQESNLLYKFIEENMVAGGSTAIIKEDLLSALTIYGYEHRVDSNKIPKNVDELGNQVVICGGCRDDKRSFKVEGKTERIHCFVLNFVWRPLSLYKSYAREEAMKTRYDMNVIEKIKKNACVETYTEYYEMSKEELERKLPWTYVTEERKVIKEILINKYGSDPEALECKVAATF